MIRARWKRFRAESMSHPDFFWAEDHRQLPAVVSGVRQILFHVTPLESLAVQKTNCRDALNDGSNRQFPFLQQVRMVLPQIVGSDTCQRLFGVLLEVVDDAKIGIDRVRCVVAAYEFLSHPLQEFGHRGPPFSVTNPTAGDLPIHAEGVRRASDFVQVG